MTFTTEKLPQVITTQEDFVSKQDTLFRSAEYKINMKDALKMLKVKNVNRRCKSCGKLVPVINAVLGQRVHCPECGAPYIVKHQVKFEIIIDPVLSA